MTSGSVKTEADPGSPPPRWVLRTMPRLQVLFNRLSGGRFFNTLEGKDVCFVTMKGAKSGRVRTVPLIYIPYEEGILLVASQGGRDENPAWYYNLLKNPDIVVNHRGRRMKLHARLASSDEKPDLWSICDQHYPPFADYRRRTARDIPIFVCLPEGRH